MNQVRISITVACGCIHIHSFVGIVTPDSSFRLQPVRTDSADTMFSENTVVFQSSFQVGVDVLLRHFQVVYLKGTIVAIYFGISFYLVSDYISDRSIHFILEFLVTFFFINRIVIVCYGSFQA